MCLYSESVGLPAYYQPKTLLVDELNQVCDLAGYVVS